jgi:hypothetical protein
MNPKSCLDLKSNFPSRSDIPLLDHQHGALRRDSNLLVKEKNCLKNWHSIPYTETPVELSRTARRAAEWSGGKIGPGGSNGASVLAKARE